MSDPSLLDTLAAALAPAGLILRGGFQPAVTDDVPTLSDGRRAGAVLLIGSAGSAMWRAFRHAVPEPAGRDPLDRWLRPQIEAAASAVDATAIFPNDGPPFVPIQRWALRSESVHRSPIHLLIHGEHGLWHAYRAAFLLARPIDFAALAPAPAQSPCDTCARTPCLTICPVEAFKPQGFDAAACLSHLESPEGRNCRERGCLARRACPVGRAHAYPAEAQKFHTAAFVRAVKAGFGRA